MYLLGKATATRLFVHPSLLSAALQAAEQTNLPKEHIYLLGTSGSRHVSQRRDLLSLIRNVRERRLPRQPIAPVRKDTLAYLVFSSGTSGRPKGTMSATSGLMYSFCDKRLVSDKPRQL